MVATAKKEPSPRKPGAESYYRNTLLALAAASVIIQIAAMGPLRNSFWGFHLLSFVSPVWAVTSWFVLGGAAVVFLFRPRRRRMTVDGAQSLARRPALLTAVLVVVCGVLFWGLRSQQRLLGDAVPLTTDLPGGKAFHPRQPLMMWLQQLLYQTIGDTFRAGNVSNEDVAHRVVATGSIVAGLLFVLVAVGIAWRLTRSTKHDAMTAFWVTSILLTQGYALLFFGYVENYTIYALFIGIYLLAALAYLGGGVPLAVVSVVFVISLGLHLSAVVMFPSLLFLMISGLRSPGRRRDAVVGIVVFVVAVLGLNGVLRSMEAGYSLWTGLAAITRIAGKTQGGGAGLPYMLSGVHVRDVVNEQYLIGPLAALLMVPAVFFAARSRTAGAPAAVFLLLVSLAFLFGSVATSEPLLGYPRDWDLFAPAAVCYTTTGLYFLLRHVKNSGRLGDFLRFGLVFSILHLAPWVWITHSDARTLERFKTLPLGNGRTEVVVANWYLRHDQRDAAMEWFKKALLANPNNSNALAFIGQLYAEDGRHDLAAEAYARAVALRPDKPNFRNNYMRTLLQLKRYEECLVQLKWLVEAVPDHIGYWRTLAFVLQQLGRTSELPAVWERTLELVMRQLKARPTDPKFNMDAGILLASLGRREEALARFNQVLATDPTSASALYNAGTILLQLGRAEEGRRLLERFLEAHPNHSYAPYARQQLGR